MENIKSYKGQTEGLIYFVLLSGARHTDEIKELIDKHFTTVKLGTLYAQISKMTANKLIQEFRASSSDGSRRKYYKITPSGLKVYNQKYATLFDGVELLEPSNYDFENTAFKNIASKRSKTKVVNEEPNKANENKDYYIATHDVDKEIDFSMFDSVLDNVDNQSAQSLYDLPSIDIPNSEIKSENVNGYEEEFEEVDNAYVLNDTQPISIVENTVNTPSQPSEPMFSRHEIEESALESAKNSKDKVDYDSFINLQYEYTDVLNKIFPKPKAESQLNEDVESAVTEEQVQTIKPQNSDWSDIYEISQKEGLKVRTSSDTNRYRGSKISMNKLLFFTCLAIFAIATFEFLLFNLILRGKIEYNENALLTIVLIFGTAVLASLIALILNPSYTIKDLPRFINSFEIALILAISSIIIIFALTAIKGVDFYNLNEMFNNLILPSIMVINAPLFIVIEYALAKLEFFQTL
ncbi:MAG: PadR family transcriptional regulator [Clostridia bacterium]|nr:PadR family transcriptional regulator [Clostridia bacterium]